MLFAWRARFMMGGMEPLSLSFRRTVAFVFFGLFVAVLVVSLLYASGYRFAEWSLTGTGGISLTVPVSGAEIFISGERFGESGFLTRSFFVDNLPSGNYTVAVVAPGFHPWEKSVIVERRFVTGLNAFLVPREFLFETLATSTATTTPLDRDFFEPSFADAVQVGAPVDDLELLVRDGNLSVRWMKEVSDAPQAFCITPRACVAEVSIERDTPLVTRAAFFSGGVVYQTNEGVFLTEIDARPTPVTALVAGPGAEFVVVDGLLVVKQGEAMMLVRGF